MNNHYRAFKNAIKVRTRSTNGRVTGIAIDFNFDSEQSILVRRLAKWEGKSVKKWIDDFRREVLRAEGWI